MRKNTKKIQPTVLQIKIDQFFQKGQYGSSSNVPDSNCFRNVCYKKIYELFTEIVKNPRMNNMGQTVLSFDQNLLKILENTTLIKQF